MTTASATEPVNMEILVLPPQLSQEGTNDYSENKTESICTIHRRPSIPYEARTRLATVQEDVLEWVQQMNREMDELCMHNWPTWPDTKETQLPEPLPALKKVMN